MTKTILKRFALQIEELEHFLKIGNDTIKTENV